MTSNITNIDRPRCSLCGVIKSDVELNGYDPFGAVGRKYRDAHCSDLAECDSDQARAMLDEAMSLTEPDNATGLNVVTNTLDYKAASTDSEREAFDLKIVAKKLGSEIARRYVEVANEYKKSEGFLGGVVTFSEGELQGWTNELRNPESWKPGCVAVAENGDLWVASGGNDFDGANRWETLTIETE